MKLIFENFRKFLNEQERELKGALGSDADSKKEKAIKKFHDDLKMFTSGNTGLMNQALETVFYPEKKPLFYHEITSTEPFSKQFETFLQQKGIIYNSTMNAINPKKTAFFLGIPENVKKAIELQKHPFIGIEEMGYPREFIKYVEDLRPTLKLGDGLSVTPKFHAELGTLLGYGKEASKIWASKTAQPIWDLVFHNWSMNQPSGDPEPTVIL
jgi:hypothetical protein